MCSYTKNMSLTAISFIPYSAFVCPSWSLLPSLPPTPSLSYSFTQSTLWVSALHVTVTLICCSKWFFKASDNFGGKQAYIFMVAFWPPSLTVFLSFFLSAFLCVTLPLALVLVIFLLSEFHLYFLPLFFMRPFPFWPSPSQPLFCFSFFLSLPSSFIFLSRCVCICSFWLQW